MQCDPGRDRGTHIRVALKLGGKDREGFLEIRTRAETWLTMLVRKQETFQAEETTYAKVQKRD